MQLTITISSGKGGTGKTFVSTNIAKVFEQMGEKVSYLDCDVEEPNGHLFLKPDIEKSEEVLIPSPVGIDADKCILCGRCAEACRYNAIALIKESVLFFKTLCHICGACTLVCPEDAIIEKMRKIGNLYHGRSGSIDFHFAELETGEGGMSTRLIKRVKKCISYGINILDSSPGTSCPVVETIKDSDLCVLVTDPTPFGIHDLKLAVDMCRELNKEPAVIVNRAEYLNEDLKRYCEDEKLEIIGEIPDDRRIAEHYSRGDLAVEKLSLYHDLFEKICLRIIGLAQEKRKAAKKSGKTEIIDINTENIECSVATEGNIIHGKEIVVISGKGGTGKTSLVACFCALEKNIAIADCDVDAADLHLVLDPEVKKKGSFSGGAIAKIDELICNGCGECFKYCRFDAVKKNLINGKKIFKIDEIACEGCGVCSIVCPNNAVILKTAINGEWYVSETRFGPMSHAKLGIAEENSGKLVSLVRSKKNELGNTHALRLSIIDGSPGTGCPVIASITGTNYAIVVTEPTVSGIHDLERVLDVTNFFGVKSGIIVNKYDLNLANTEDIKKITDKNNSDFLGLIPYDKSITEAQMKGISMVEYTDNNTTQAIKGIWENVKDSCLDKVT